MAFVSEPVRFAYNNHVSLSGTTVSANSEVDSLPWSNLSNAIPSKVGRTATTNSVRIDYTFDQARDVQQFALLNHNLTSSASMTLSAATNSSFSPVALNSGLTVQEGLPVLHEFASSQSFQFWRVEITDTTDEGYIEAGHSFLGPYDQFDFPPAATEIRVIDPSIKRTSFDNSLNVFKKTKFKEVNFSISSVDQIERRNIESVYDDVGIGKAFYLFLDPKNNRDDEDVSTGKDGYHRLTVYGYFQGGLGLDHINREWHNVTGFSFREAL